MKKVKNKTPLLSTKYRIDWVLLTVVSTLCIFGLAFLASSLSVKSEAIYNREFFKQLVLGLGLGGFLAAILARVPYQFLFKRVNILIWINFLMLGFLAIFALYVNIAGFNGSFAEKQAIRNDIVRSVDFLPIKPHVANGAIRWIDFPFLPNFQPSEFSKLALFFSHFG